MASEDHYLAVLKASFDYEPQDDADDELAIKENQILFLIERTDDSWWKVKLKTDTPEEQGATGLVPAAYVEEAERISVVKVLYDYQADQPTELTVQEDEILHVYEKDDGWLLVQSQKPDGGVGYVPENYTEEASDEGDAQDAAAPSAPSRIVIPDSPPRPEYVDPAERVGSNRVQADDIQTWAVSEVDKKGKKKKGTLGIGNGAIFFASESDKTPVQKWQMTDIQSHRIEKNKHVHIDIEGSNATHLHFHAGSKDTAEAIIKKLESSKALSVPAPSSPQAGPSNSRPSPPPEIERPRSAVPKAVHFDDAEPVIIPDEEEEEEHHAPPPRAERPRYVPEPDPEPEPEPVPAPRVAARVSRRDDDEEYAAVLYDFTADGDDELTIHEGERLVVLDKDSDEWWKVRNQRGLEGVVPAQYVELEAGGSTRPAAVTAEPEEDSEFIAAQEAADRAAQEEAERVADEADRAERERAEQERKRKQEADARARAAAASAEAERRKREQEREKQKEKERAAARAAELEEEQRKKKANRDSISSDSSARAVRNESSGSSGTRRTGDRRATTSTGPPPSGKLRTWHDRTGQFKVEAVFLGYENEKLRLHKSNGVIIEVPAHKMSPEDMQYVERALKHSRGPSPSRSEDDEPLATRRQSLLQQTPRSAPTKPTQPAKKGPTIDWFEFFLNAGCDIDDCTRYANAFERDKMDESILPDITESIMRSLGLREGDIIRVKKAIEQRKGSTFLSNSEEARKEQVRKDEELARRLQAEENGGKKCAQAPNLFAAGPNGVLKNNTVRRGRPQPSKSLPPTAVDINSIASASDQIQRSSTPLIGTPATPTPPPRGGSGTLIISGFDDDAWTNRPASTKPLTPTPVPKATSPPARPPSAPVAQTTAPTAPTAVTQTQSLPSPPTTSTTQVNATTSPSLAKTTESDIFDQLARLSQLRVRSPPAAQPAVAQAATISPPPVSTPSIVTPPAGYQSGMGMGASPVPMGQHLQAQQTGFLPPANGPRGPFAPVPANQSLLQPLIPTTTGFNSFVPTRPQSTPISFQPAPPPPIPPVPPLPPQQTFRPPPPPIPPLPPQQSFLSAQPTGFPGAPQSPFSQQVNGYNPSPMMAQPTGLGGTFGGSPFNSGGLGTGLNPGLSLQPQVPPLSANSMNPGLNGFGQLQPTPTGFNTGFNAMPFNHTISPPPAPPPPPMPQQQNTNPANVFAQMKSGTFGTDNSNSPQNAEKYDALRPAPSPLAAQPTGWGGYGVGGMPGGYGY